MVGSHTAPWRWRWLPPRRLPVVSVTARWCWCRPSLWCHHHHHHNSCLLSFLRLGICLLLLFCGTLAQQPIRGSEHRAAGGRRRGVADDVRVEWESQCAALLVAASHYSAHKGQMHIVFMGDSTLRYQFLGLLHAVHYNCRAPGKQGKRSPEVDFPPNWLAWKRGSKPWHEFYNDVIAYFGSENLLADVHRDDMVKFPWVENWCVNAKNSFEQRSSSSSLVAVLS